MRSNTGYAQAVFRYVLLAVALTLALAASAGAAKPPAIAGQDVLTGRHVALSQYGRKPVLVVVWGSWCYGCRTEAPTLARFVRAHSRQAAFLGINTEDSKQGARAFAHRFGLRLPSIWDPRGILAGAWSRGAPTLLVFNRRHVLLKRVEGTASLAQLDAALKDAMA